MFLWLNFHNIMTPQPYYIPAFTVGRFCKGGSEPRALVIVIPSVVCDKRSPLMCLIKAHWTVAPVAFDGGRITRDYNGIRCPHSVCFIIYTIKRPEIFVLRALIFSLLSDGNIYIIIIILSLHVSTGHWNTMSMMYINIKYIIR